MSSAGSAGVTAQQPVIAGYGRITPVEGAVERPDHSLRYRVLFSVTKAASSPDKVNPSLEKVARFLNLLGADGVRPAQGDVIVIVHGPATPIIADDEAYGGPVREGPKTYAKAGARLRRCGAA